MSKRYSTANVPVVLMNIPVLKNTFLSKFQYNRQIYEVRLKVSDIKRFLGDVKTLRELTDQS